MARLPPLRPASGYGSPAPPPGPASPYAYGPSPQPVDSQGRPLSGWWLRFGAIFLDGIILSIVPYILTRIFVRHETYGGRHLVGGVIIIGLIFSVVDIVYFAYLNGSDRGQTLGQMMLGIAVRDETSGGAIGPQRAALRILVLSPGLILELDPRARHPGLPLHHRRRPLPAVGQSEAGLPRQGGPHRGRQGPLTAGS